MKFVRNCIFSPDRQHRYKLWRGWKVGDLFTARIETGFVQFIGLNPSTADEVKDDPTIRRCVDFSKRWGYGALCMTNLFAFRATDPDDMKDASDPIGPENMTWLRAVAMEADVVVAAWGNHGLFNGQSDVLKKAMHDWGITLHCLRITGSNQPEHPLYLPAKLTPIVFN